MFEEFNNRLSNSELSTEIINLMDKHREISIDSISGSIFSFFSVFLFKKLKKDVLLILPDDYYSYFYEDIKDIVPERDILLFPSEESSVYEDFLSDSEIRSERIKTLFRLQERQKKHIIITTPKALLTKVVSPRILKRNSFSIKTNDEIPFELFADSIMELGFKRVDMVRFKAEYAVRGGIIDIFPVDYEFPVRIEFFGDNIDSLRFFDPATQRSVEDISTISIIPEHEIIMNDHYTDNAVNSIKKLFIEKYPSLTEDIIEKLKRKEPFPGIEKYKVYYYDELSSFTEYLSSDTVRINYKPGVLERHWIQSIGNLQELYEKKSKLDPFIPRVDKIASYFRDFSDEGKQHTIINIHPRKIDHSKGHFSYPGHEGGNFYGDFDKFREKCSSYIKQGYLIFLACDNEGQKERMKEILDDLKETLIFQVGHITQGFIDKKLKIAIFTDHELFSKLPRRRSRKIRKPTVQPMDMSALRHDDYVVHEDYGIGVYRGIKRIDLNESEYDCLELEYLNEDKLFVPVDQIHRVEKYSSKDAIPPVLSKLGTTQWTRLKEKTQKAIEQLALELLDIYAARKSQKGFVFLPDDIKQKEMEAAFPYEETDDQLKALQDVKSDMEKPLPMDRLICGDVGFGKTEIAIRGAFKAFRGGKQTCVLAPTTLLAQQHYETFGKRLEKFGLITKVLSRFVSPSDQKKHLKELKNGEIHVVVGTHRLLSKDVKFKDLGLLIIDEEQRFGVKHKEKIKSLKKTVDVLTMTATPIPRTLNMSLIGARDISVINTPPRDRLSIQTELIYFDKELIREAIIREINRKGQVFFVHNRVRSIYEIAETLKRIVPGIRIGIAHGQMDTPLLEDVMLRFANKEIDLLIATMIIENGIDIPNVNTIIIDLADRLGLSQLYQLRGRVGRSNIQAYAFLIIPPLDKISPLSLKRVEAVKEFSHLGSGMALAMKDMEIRGVGNILGPQQHGFANAIGFDLYCKLLEETVNRIKGEPLKSDRPIEIQAKIKAYIDHHYISEDSTRIYFYQNIVKSRNLESLIKVKNEMIDRFGPLPEEVKNLFIKFELSIQAKKMQFNKVIVTKQNIMGVYEPENVPHKDFIFKLIKNSSIPINIKSDKSFSLEYKHKAKTIISQIVFFNSEFMKIGEFLNEK